MPIVNYCLNALKLIAVSEVCTELDPPSLEKKYWIHSINSGPEESG